MWYIKFQKSKIETEKVLSMLFILLIAVSTAPCFWASENILTTGKKKDLV